MVTDVRRRFRVAAKTRSAVRAGGGAPAGDHALISMPNRPSAAARPVVALGVRSAIAAVF